MKKHAGNWLVNPWCFSGFTITSQAKDVGSNSGRHLQIFPSLCVKFHFKFSTSFTVKKNIVSQPAQTSKATQWRVWRSQSALGPCGSYSRSPIIQSPEVRMYGMMTMNKLNLTFVTVIIYHTRTLKIVYVVLQFTNDKTFPLLQILFINTFSSINHHTNTPMDA